MLYSGKRLKCSQLDSKRFLEISCIALQNQFAAHESGQSFGNSCERIPGNWWLICRLTSFTLLDRGWWCHIEYHKSICRTCLFTEKRKISQLTFFEGTSTLWPPRPRPPPYQSCWSLILSSCSPSSSTSPSSSVFFLMMTATVVICIRLWSKRLICVPPQSERSLSEWQRPSETLNSQVL